MTVSTTTVFGRLLALTRARRGLTQAQLAAQLGITRETIASIENGYAAPSFPKLLTLGAAGQAFAPGRLIRLLHLVSAELQRLGCRVVNRPTSDTDLHGHAGRAVFELDVSIERVLEEDGRVVRIYERPVTFDQSESEAVHA